MHARDHGEVLVTWLVTGGAGFLGVHLLRSLVERGLAARSVDLTPGAPAGVEEIVGDVRDERVLREALDGVDVVVHAAAALPSGGDLEKTNVEGSSRLARLAAEHAVQRAVLVSSGVVYGVGASPYRESDSPRPIERYGRSKLRAEEAWLAAAPAPLVLRPAAFIGPERLGVFGILFRWVCESRRIYVLGNGSNRYQLLDVADLVAAIVLAGASEAQGVLNVGGLVSGAVRGDLETLVAHAGSESRIVGVPAKPARAVLSALGAVRLSPLTTWHVRSADRDFVLDCARAAEVLDWTPSRSGAEALCGAYDWYVREGASKPTGTTHRSTWRERGLSALRRIS
jgi:nucleoside-diphosphate-sugar epimerase